MFEIIHTPHSISLIFFHIVAAYSLLQYGSQVEFELSNLHRLIQRPISTSSPHSCWCGGGLLRWYLSHNGISLINRHQNDVLSITILSLHNLYFHTHILCIHTVFPLIFLLPPPLKLLPHWSSYPWRSSSLTIVQNFILIRVYLRRFAFWEKF